MSQDVDQLVNTMGDNVAKETSANFKAAMLATVDDILNQKVPLQAVVPVEAPRKVESIAPVPQKTVAIRWRKWGGWLAAAFALSFVATIILKVVIF